MASLTGQLVAETYKALLKTIDNDILTASEKQITDGLGGGSNVFIDSQGFLRANKYKVTNGLATQFLKADGSLDANTYLTGITSSQIITALGYTPVPTTRTLTINGTTYDLSANRSWTVAGTAAVWGNITGTLSNQTDLQTALNAKYNNPTGTISQYIRGDGSLATFPTLPGGLPTGGTAGQILAKIDATDYNTHWIDNFATQTKNEVKLGQTLAKGAAVYVSSANGTNMIVSAASNTTEAASSKTLGLLETGGVANDLVKCVTFGLLAGLDTSTATAGDPVWLGVNGALIFGLANKPVAPAHMVYIGVVTRVQSNNGEIFVNVQNGFELNEIHDVSITSVVNNQGLFYESSTGLWKNKSIATVLGYTPQAQLDGTGFVKASGTTISYDNSTYLTTTDAASTYQRLDRMAINLLASDIQYPNNNAVIAALALKANAANPVFTGNMTISGAEPKLFFTDTDNNPDYTVFIDSGVFFIYDQTAGATRFSISSTGNISSGVGKSITAGSFVKESGLATQFLKADGSIDSSTYVTSTALADYLLITTAASTYQRLDRIASSLFASATNYPNNNAVIAGLALKADAANPVFTGSMNIQGLESRINFYDENNLRKFFIGYSSGQLSIYQDAGSATRFVINSSGNITTGVNNTITSWGFIKSGGTSSQYLMADGSVTTLSNPVSGTGTTNYVASWTISGSLGNSTIYDNGTNVGIATNTPFNGINNRGLNIQRGGHSTLLLGDGFTYGGVVQSSDDIKRVFVGANIFDDPSNAWSQFVDGSGYAAVDVIGQGDGSSLVRLLNGSGNDSGYGGGNIFFESYKSNSNSYIKLRTNTDNAFYIFNSGNVALNTATDSGFKLDVNGTGRFIGTLQSDNATTAELRLRGGGYGSNYNTSLRSLAGAIGVLQFGNNDANYVLIGNTATGGYLDFRSNVSGESVSSGNFAMRINANGNIGINSTNSSEKLYVNGKILGVGKLFIQRESAGADTLIQFKNEVGSDRAYINFGGTNEELGFYSGAGGTRNMIIGSDGAMGFNYPTLAVRSFMFRAISGRPLAIEIAESGGVQSVYIRPNSSGRHLITSNYLSGGVYLPLALSGRENDGDLVLATSGNVLINTATDSGYKLDINGTARIQSRTTISASLGSSSDWALGVTNSNSTSFYAANGAGFGMYLDAGSIASSSTYVASFVSNGVSRLFLRGDGYIGINTGSPSAFLHINESSYGTGLLITTSSISGADITLTNTGSGGKRWDITSGGSNNAIGAGGLQFYNNTDGLMRMGISSAGNVLIGTATDGGFPLLVGKGRDGWQTAFVNNSSYGTTQVFFGHGEGYGAYIDSGAHGNSTARYIFKLVSGGTERVVVRGDGLATFSSSITATSFFESSDFRLKTLIESNPIVDGIENLQAKLYEKNGKIEMGYFAQDAEKLMPYAVKKNEDGFLNLSYREVHTAKIARLEKRVAELEKQLNLN